MTDHEPQPRIQFDRPSRFLPADILRSLRDSRTKIIMRRCYFGLRVLDVLELRTPSYMQVLDRWPAPQETR